jgi:hypothetical protein
MALNVCPADTVHAPIDRIWNLLTHPADYGRFWDLTVERVEPEGPAVVGQRFVGWSWGLGKRWRIDGNILEVDAERHHILFRMGYPFGVVSTNRLMCTPTGEDSCLVRFG